MKALASLDVGKAQLRWHDSAPVALRPTGPGRVHLVQAAGGPLGGDELGIEVTVAAGAEVEVRSAAATVAQPGPGGEAACWTVNAMVDGALRWWPEPTVVCANADYRARLCVDLADDARLVLREQVVLGRAGEVGGRYRGRLTVRVGGVPLLDTETVLDGADAVLSGPAGSAGFRVFGSVLVAGPDLPTVEEAAIAEAGMRGALLPLDGPGYLVIALASTSALVESALARFPSNASSDSGIASRS